MNFTITRGPQTGFKGFKIERQSLVSKSKTVDINQIPAIESSAFPPPYPGGGAIAYNVSSKRVFYSDGTGWFPIGGEGTSINSFGFIKDGNLNVLSTTETVLGGWEINSSPTYHTTSGWNLTSGIFTANIDSILSLEIGISWASNESNLGERFLKIQYNSGLGWNDVKETSTQADPDVNIVTTQECSIHLKLNQGDLVRVVVNQNSPFDLTILGGRVSSISGFVSQ